MSTVLVGCLVAAAAVFGWPAVFARPARRRLSWASPRAVVAGVSAAAAAGLAVGGPVLAVVAGAYAGLAGRAVLRRTARRRARAERAAALAGLGALAADLRAGLPPTGSGRGELAHAAADVGPGRAGAAGRGRSAPETLTTGRLERLASSVWRLAERTGAPAADLVERIEADARAADRAADSAAAQAAGAQATALLLAGLPAGGIGLGIGIGADPVGVLLHTPMGAACAAGAVVLQTGGLIWTDRLTAGATR
jgi:tight adherence protein B